VELTPDARIARAKRVIAEAITDLVDAQVAKGVAASEWIDQDASPLGKRRHLELVRTRVLKGVREGRKVLVRRRDLDAYLVKRGESPAVEDDDDVEGMMNAAIMAGARR
jgi:hypothetical protein